MDLSTGFFKTVDSALADGAGPRDDSLKVAFKMWPGYEPQGCTLNIYLELH